MPIWRSSELAVGRSGSPSRRNSARSSSAQPNTSRNPALPPLRTSGDGVGAGNDSQQPVVFSHAQCPPGLASAPSYRKAASGCASVSSISSSSWEASQAATLGSYSAYLPTAGSTHNDQHAPSMQGTTPVATPRRRASSGMYGTTAQTYTVQYIGIANGELGILSQKQKLAPQRSSGSSNSTVSSAPASGSTVAAPSGVRRDRSRSAAAAQPFAPAPALAVLSSRGAQAALPSTVSAPAGLQEGAVGSGRGLGPAAEAEAAAPPPFFTGSPVPAAPAPASATALSTQPAAQTSLGALGPQQVPPSAFAIDGSEVPAPQGPHHLHHQPSSSSLVQGTSSPATPPPLPPQPVLDAADDAEAAASAAPFAAASAALRPPQAPGLCVSGPGCGGLAREENCLPSTAATPASGDVSTTLASLEVASGPAPEPGTPPKPPSLVSIVDDARGQVKVVTECFFSRALHSRAAPHDRHTRRNRPLGPQVRDMEPLSTGLPNRFAHRAPSAGGFSGWKLSAAVGAAPSGSTAAAVSALAGLHATAAGARTAAAAAAAAAATAAAAVGRPRGGSARAGRAPVGLTSGSMLTASPLTAAGGGGWAGAEGEDGATARPASRGICGAMLKQQVL